MPYRKTRSARLNKPSTGTPLDLGAPINAGLVSFWAFNEGAGLKVNDLARKNSGTLTNVVQSATSGWTPAGKFGPTILFDGNNDFVSVADNPTLSFVGKPFSISFWLKRTNTASAAEGIIGKYQNPLEWVFGYTNLGQDLWFFVYDNTNGAYIGQSIQAGAAFGDGQWHHVVGTYNGVGTTAAATTLWIDGAVIGGGTAVPLSSGTFVSCRDTSSILTIGKATTWSATSFNGALDLVRIYSRELHSPDVQVLFRDALNGWVYPRRRIIDGIGIAPGQLAPRSLIVSQAVKRASNF